VFYLNKAWQEISNTGMNAASSPGHISSSLKEVLVENFRIQAWMVIKPGSSKQHTFYSLNYSNLVYTYLFIRFLLKKLKRTTVVRLMVVHFFLFS
jgi:hypothetical protein